MRSTAGFQCIYSKSPVLIQELQTREKPMTVMNSNNSPGTISPSLFNKFSGFFNIPYKLRWEGEDFPAAQR